MAVWRLYVSLLNSVEKKSEVVASGENSSTFCVLIQEVNCTCFSQYKCLRLLDIGFRWRVILLCPGVLALCLCSAPYGILGCRFRPALSHCHQCPLAGPRRSGQGVFEAKGKSGPPFLRSSRVCNPAAHKLGCKPVASRTCPTRMICFENPNPPSLVPSCPLCYTIADLTFRARA